MKLSIKKAAVIIKPNIKLKEASTIMMPEHDLPQNSVKTQFDLAIEENQSVTDFVENEIMAGVCNAANLVADEESTRCGFDVSPLKKFTDEPVNIELYDSEENPIATILNAHIHGKPKFSKPEGDTEAKLYLSIVGNVTMKNLETMIVFIGADAFISIDAAQVEMFSSEADKVENKIAEVLKVETKAQVFFDSAFANGEFDDANQIMNAAHGYASRRIDEGHSKKKVIVADIKNAIDFCRVPSTNDFTHVA